MKTFSIEIYFEEGVIPILLYEGIEASNTHNAITEAHKMLKKDFNGFKPIKKIKVIEHGQQTKRCTAGR